MAEIHALVPSPDVEIMRAALYELFRYSIRGCVELGWSDRSGALRHAKQFDVGDLDDLAAFAARINATSGQNVYVSAGLRRADMDRDHRAADADVVAVAALKIDCDAPGCLDAALSLAERIGLRPSLAHFSGRHPHVRGALWWVLEEPEPDLARVRRLEEGLARAFESDAKVVNSSRVMRLPGSVAWPIKQGRIVEATGAYATPTRQQPYSMDEVESALRRHTPRAAPDQPTVLDFSAASKSLELESMLIQAVSAPSQWHQNALLATAHLVGRHTPPDVIVDVLAPRLTMPGYSEAQTRAELAVMIHGAVTKWGGEAPEANKSRPVVDLSASQNPFVTLDEMLAREPPEWLVDGYLSAGGLSVLWGASGAYKSFVAIDLALSVASGLPWHGRAVKQQPVLYICAEGQYGFGVRALAWREHKLAGLGAGGAVGADLSGIKVLPVPVNFLEPGVIGKLTAAAETFGVNAGLVIVDTLARNFGGGDENATRDMNLFVHGATSLAAAMGAHVLLVHHTGKDDSKGERGSYSLRGAVDTSIKLVRDGKSDRISLEHFKQKDGPELDPMPLRMASVEAIHPVTGEVVTSLIPVLDDAPREADGASPLLSASQRRALDLVTAGSGTLATLSARGGVDRSNLRRDLARLLMLRVIRISSGGVYFCEGQVESV